VTLMNWSEASARSSRRMSARRREGDVRLKKEDAALAAQKETP
jgi:hypothetical protein